ncbi:alpha/beta fold hydrolase [Gangjinia marincola]|uniref:Alpha/beta fold hydrolase n=1 Tax=Gangjinia marincola TaxID=578463 RepID=A0ABP3XSB8_9FLAO
MKKVLRWLVVLTGLFLLMMTLLITLQEKIIFLPTTLPQDYSYSFDQDFEEVFIETGENVRINGLYFSSEKPKGLIVYFHGNAGDLSRWGEIASYFVQFGYDVLVTDYRTYGKSTGELSEKALYQDAEAIYDYAKRRFSEDQITLYGRSLGCTFAAYLASNNQPKQLVLETPFYSLESLVKERFPVIPLRYLEYSFPTNTFVEKIDCPVVIYHGTQDEVVPYESGRRLANEFPIGQATLVTLESGGHNNLIEFSKYRASIKKVLE